MSIIMTRFRKISSFTLKEGGTQKNIFPEITNLNTSGGFEPEVGLTDHQNRYRLRYAAGKVRRLSLPISARPFFSLNTSLNTLI